MIKNDVTFALKLKKRISVIVTAYNLDKLIGRAIQSIIDQTYTNLEIMIVDDGSGDETSSICDHMALYDPRVCVVHKCNEGLAAARKTGAEFSSGDYVGFVDADDTIESDMYEFLLNNAVKHKADISHCGYRMIMPDGKKKEFYGTHRVVLQNHDKGIYDLLCGDCIEPTTCNKIYRRELFDNISFVTDVKINEDLMLNSMLFAAADKSVYCDECKYNYFQYEISMSSTISEKHFLDPVIIRQKILENYRSESPEIYALAKTKLVDQYIANCSMIIEKNLVQYRALLYENMNSIKEMMSDVDLCRNSKVRALLILYMPRLYKPVHRLYRLLHGKGKYE